MAGCSKSPAESIVGTWFDAESDSTVVFSEDGTFSIDHEWLGVTGEYRLLADNQMSIDITEGVSEPLSAVVTYELHGDRLIVTDPGGDITEMHRTSP